MSSILAGKEEKIWLFMELKRTYKLFETTALREYRVSNSYALKSNKNWFGLQSVYHGLGSKIECNLKVVWHDLWINIREGRQKLDTNYVPHSQLYWTHPPHPHPPPQISDVANKYAGQFVAVIGLRGPAARPGTARLAPGMSWLENVRMWTL